MSDLARGRELLPCPFCGGNRIRTREGDTYRWLDVGCAECDVWMCAAKHDRAKPHDDPANMPGAVEQWNRRPARRALAGGKSPGDDDLQSWGPSA